MKVLSLFTGIGAFEKALKNIGIDYELIGFSEIDKYAIKSYCAIHNVSEEKNLGDITKIDITKLPKDIDLITHGSPCQDFSVAGKQAGGDLGTGTRSSLMWNTINIVTYCKPKYVIWENVKNLLSKKHRHNFDSYLSIMESLGYNNYYDVLNAKDYGIPQNRERVYTVSIRKDIDNGNFVFPEKEELKLRLKDMLEDKVDEKYYLSDKLIAGLIANTERQRAKGNGFTFETTDGDCVAKTVTTRVGACRSGDNYIQVVGKLDIKGHDCVKRVYSGEGLAPTLTDMQGGNRQPKIMIVGNYMPSGHDASRIVDEEGIAPTVKENHGTVTAVAIRGKYNEPVIAASRGRNPDRPGDRTPGILTEQRLEINKQGISNTITTVQKDNYVIEPCLKIKEATKAGYKEAYAGDGVNISGRMKYQRGNVQKEMTQTLMANGSERGVVTPDMRIRKLTPRECWRLMSFGDEDFDKAAFTKTKAYIEGGTKICNAKLKVVKEKQRHIDTDTYVLCTTNNTTEQDYQEKIIKTLCISKEQVEKIQNVNIAIELLEETELKECAISIIKCGDYMETLYTLIKNLEHYHTAIIELEKTDSTSTEKYMKITSEENLDLVKSYIISILIKQIIASKIYGVITQKANIQGLIAIITDYKKNLMIMKLLNLKMEFTTRLNSDTALYKQAGNSIVVNVLEKIFENLFKGE